MGDVKSPKMYKDVLLCCGSYSVPAQVIARGTPGFSGADLANLINIGALKSARDGLLAVRRCSFSELTPNLRHALVAILRILALQSLAEHIVGST